MSLTVSLVDENEGGTRDFRRCVLTGELDFTSANNALESVGALITEYESLEINLSGVTSTNSAGLALLIEWLAMARTSQHSITFSHIPDSLRQLASVCEVDGLI
jgi:phospholipid transport system transporter-binding protein